MLPEVETVEASKATYLAVWDASIGGLEPTPSTRRSGESVLERTLDQLAEAIRAE